MSHRPGPPAKPLKADNPLKRRGVLLGAGAAGGAALVATAIPVATPEVATAAAATAEAADTAAGYRLSAHVLRYYETTRS
jgi:hypothetical protein